MSVARVFGLVSKNGFGLKMASSLSKGSSVASSSSSMITKDSLFNQSWYQPSSVTVRNYHHLSRQNNLSVCTCNACSRRMASGSPLGLHTKVDKDLSVFLKSEVEAERQLSKVPKHGPGVPGFEVKAEGANVTLTKKVGQETVSVKFNVNGVLDTEDEPNEPIEGQQEPPMPDMRARPDFVVEISKPNGRILAVTCRLIPDDGSEELQENDGPRQDKFEIESFTVLNAEDIDEDGDWDENIYMADGTIIDGHMYDLLLSFLESRGINSEFVDSFMDYATHYEHNNYIGLLEKLRDFVEK